MLDHDQLSPEDLARSYFADKPRRWMLRPGAYEVVRNCPLGRYIEVDVCFAIGTVTLATWTPITNSCTVVSRERCKYLKIVEHSTTTADQQAQSTERVHPHCKGEVQIPWKK